MNHNISTSNKISFLLIFCTVIGIQVTCAQQTEVNQNLSSSNTYHNQLFFNRFLINPTFSLVRENKSYLNILHRNQYATFEDNSQNYFLGFSNKLNENTALGIGVYSQWSGVVQEFGFNANYATAVKLGAKSRLTFGANVTYFNSGLDKNRVVATENDPNIIDARKESKIAVQPGITLSVGKFDFGLYAEDLLRYNQTTNEFLTNLNDKSIKASLQYTQTFNASRGLFADARLMPLVQMGRNENGSVSYLGSVLLDLPNYGWFQTTMDDQYGLSMGLGFNISKKMSLGYLMEKDVLQGDTDLGWNHEISMAYTFKNENDVSTNYTSDSEDARIDKIVRNYEEQILALKEENDKQRKRDKTRHNENKTTKTDANALAQQYRPIEGQTVSETDANSLAYQNRLILDELILRQDSIEAARNEAFERRFETIVRVIRSDIKQNLKAAQNINTVSGTLLATNSKAVEPVAKTKVVKTNHRKDFLELPPIKSLGKSDVVGVTSGYYVIANVYKNKVYLNAFMNDLKKKGLNPKKFYNKENGLHYVYLADFDVKQDAETAFVSNLGGKYNDEKWIMQVDHTTATAANMYEDGDGYE
ncbi:PorP/SprF family type IX secretion system membrane protein [Costertonia aggregata]|uniref:PorP/SprF family type IX secretion system membrane protein n=1 Tax=Costertonia aggregata TaxID=343403 RepID=A0A7H9AT45_9FLAO|nr:type IX secretion system membrane protein PorP/SprF [Costertonia aggregata]QLG46651.1 PorP/SprF family type IX secretion system membrane protein [Costertonia aggregata]